MSIFRQGDIFLIRIPDSQVPKGLSQAPTEKHQVEGEETDCYVLAHGEVTGHAHVFEATDDVVFLESDMKDMADRFLRVETEEVLLRHEEHRTLHIPKGTYRVRRQREWQPDAPPVYVRD